jgi:hypothetical protein
MKNATDVTASVHRRLLRSFIVLISLTAVVVLGVQTPRPRRTERC